MSDINQIKNQIKEELQQPKPSSGIENNRFI